MWSPTWVLNLNPNVDLVLVVYSTCKIQSALCLLTFACGLWQVSKTAATALTQDGSVVITPIWKGDVFCRLPWAILLRNPIFCSLCPVLILHSIKTLWAGWGIYLDSFRIQSKKQNPLEGDSSHHKTWWLPRQMW